MSAKVCWSGYLWHDRERDWLIDICCNCNQVNAKVVVSSNLNICLRTVLYSLSIYLLIVLLCLSGNYVNYSGTTTAANCQLPIVTLFKRCFPGRPTLGVPRYPIPSCVELPLSVWAPGRALGNTVRVLSYMKQLNSTCINVKLFALCRQLEDKLPWQGG